VTRQYREKKLSMVFCPPKDLCPAGKGVRVQPDSFDHHASQNLSSDMALIFAKLTSGLMRNPASTSVVQR
jgi:hypothetical protein